MAAVVAELGDPAIAGPLATDWGALLEPAAARGLLCSGPEVDGAVSGVSPAGVAGPTAGSGTRRGGRAGPRCGGSWPPTARPPPSTSGRWWGEQPAPATRVIRAAGDTVAAVTVDGEAGFVLRAEDADELAATRGGSDPADAPLLLPGFGPWVISPLSHRTRAVPRDACRRCRGRPGGSRRCWSSTGWLRGLWEHAGPTITLRPFDPLPPATRAAVEQAAARC